MSDEFQGGVCGGNWWNSSRNGFGSSSLCLSNDITGFGWPGDNLLIDMKSSTRSSDESGSASDGSVVLQDSSVNGINNLSMDHSTLQMTESHDWNQALFQNKSGCESNYTSMLQEDLNSGMNCVQESGIICTENYSSLPEGSSTNNTFEHMNQTFAMNSPSSSYGYPTNLMQTLFDANPQSREKSRYEHQTMNFPSSPSNYLTNVLNDFSPSLPILSPMLKASLPFSNNTSVWNTPSAALNNIRTNLLPSSTISENINLQNHTTKFKRNHDIAKRNNDEPTFKRPRIETPSPLPTFKVRKEKLGDRITALQQLVSPFGKTDTASVLHEAIEYIKFLHDQVNVLSTPYMKNGSPAQRQQATYKTTDQEGSKHDLRSRGLCLVPISSTFPVASETTSDFWTPTFGGAFSKEKWEAWNGGGHINGLICKY